MNPNLIWLLILLSVYPVTGMALITVGQPVRPLDHLLKATLFWSIIVWVLVAVGVSVL